MTQSTYLGKEDGSNEHIDSRAWVPKLDVSTTSIGLIVKIELSYQDGNHFKYVVTL